MKTEGQGRTENKGTWARQSQRHQAGPARRRSRTSMASEEGRHNDRGEGDATYRLSGCNRNIGARKLAINCAWSRGRRYLSCSTSSSGQNRSLVMCRNSPAKERSVSLGVEQEQDERETGARRRGRGRHDQKWRNDDGARRNDEHSRQDKEATASAVESKCKGNG